MPNNTQKLREAVAQESADIARRETEYHDLLKKMAAYQDGTGPAPTSQEFAQWRDAVARALKVRAIKSGFGDLPNL